jgi:hypothetical protein
MQKHFSWAPILAAFLMLPFVFAAQAQDNKQPPAPPKVADDRLNNIVYQGTIVEFKNYAPKDENGGVIDGIFYIPVVDKKSLGPHRASPGAIITVLVSPDGSFKCPKDLRKRLDDAKRLTVATITPEAKPEKPKPAGSK